MDVKNTLLWVHQVDLQRKGFIRYKDWGLRTSVSGGVDGGGRKSLLCVSWDLNALLANTPAYLSRPYVPISTTEYVSGITYSYHDETEVSFVVIEGTVIFAIYCPNTVVEVLRDNQNMTNKTGLLMKETVGTA